MNVPLIVYRRLEGLADEDLEYFRGNDVERVIEADDGFYVDGDQARDFEYTQLVIEKTTAYAVASDEGEILARFETLTEAEAARANAKVTFSIELPGADEVGDLRIGAARA